MIPFTTHDGITINRPGVEVWQSGYQQTPVRHVTPINFNAMCYSGRVFATRAGAMAYRREILLKRRAEIDAELAQLESEAGQ